MRRVWIGMQEWYPHAHFDDACERESEFLVVANVDDATLARWEALEGAYRAQQDELHDLYDRARGIGRYAQNREPQP